MSKWFAVLCLLAAAAGSASGQWGGDPLTNTPLSLADGEKNDVFVVTDTAGGAIVVWEDERDGDSDIYAQRVDVNGIVLWQTDGVPVCTAPGDQHLYNSSTSTTGFTPVLADGVGGAFIVWHDARNYSLRLNDIYCQRVDADGDILLPQNGIVIAGGSGTEDQPTMCSDAEGGAIIVWQDKNDDPVFYNLYGQRIDGNGYKLWNGGASQLIAGADFNQDGPTLCPDGSGGAFVAWTDGRTNLNDVYAQRVNASGVSQWTPNGVPVYQNANGQDALAIVLAADNHPILTWVDRRTGTPDIYAQKLDAVTGGVLWNTSGVAVCSAAESQYRPALATDSAGGAIITWYDFRDAGGGPPFDLNIYSQRILTDGTPAWVTDGVIVCGAADAQRDPDICADGSGGAFIAWEDNRLGTGHEDIYAQHIDDTGMVLLDADGNLVCSAPHNQLRPDIVAGAGGLITAWKDDRNILYEPDIYADRVLTTTNAVIGVNRVTLDFGVPPWGAISDTFSVSNVGGSDLVVSAVELEQHDPAFEVVYLAELPATLTPGEIVPVSVTFHPVTARSDTLYSTDTVLIFHDAPENPSPVAVSLRGGTIVTGVEDDARTPAHGVNLLQNHPNPFNPSTTITFVLIRPRHVLISVYDMTGRKLAVLTDRVHEEGHHSLRWDGKGQAGQSVSAGTYLVRLETEEGSDTLKIVLLR